MSITKMILRAASPFPHVENYQRFLFIGPHPDDIEIGAGATAARFAAEGKDICFLICTDGRYGDGHIAPGTTPEEVVAIRKAEATLAAGKLGVKDVRFGGLTDGGFYSYDDMVQTIAATIGDFQPDVIFCPDPDVVSECHKDHLCVGKVSKQIACFAPYPGIMKQYGAASAPVKAIAFYFTAKPNRYVDTAKTFPQQLDALLTSHLSQFPAGGGDAKYVKLYLSMRAYEYGLRCFSKTAEGFRVLSPVQMHCMPESDT